MIVVELVSKHGDERPHRKWLDVECTPDPWSFFIPSASPVEEANGTRWSSSYPVIAMFWPGVFYQVFVLLKPVTTEYYCNVIVPLVYYPAVKKIEFIDLELDVYVSDKGVEPRDVEEFEAVRKGYPLAWVEGARNAFDELQSLGRARSGPFSAGTARAWRDFAQKRT
jgi:uncharacterized protein